MRVCIHTTFILISIWILKPFCWERAKKQSDPSLSVLYYEVRNPRTVITSEYTVNILWSFCRNYCWSDVNMIYRTYELQKTVICFNFSAIRKRSFHRPIRNVHKLNGCLNQPHISFHLYLIHYVPVFVTFTRVYKKG